MPRELVKMQMPRELVKIDAETRGLGPLASVAETAREYIRQARAPNTVRAYRADKHRCARAFTREPVEAPEQQDVEPALGGIYPVVASGGGGSAGRFTRPARSLLGLKVTTRLAAIVIVSPVCGFRPCRAFFSLT